MDQSIDYPSPSSYISLGNFVDIKKVPKDLFIIDSGGFSYINPAMFAGAFAQDVNSARSWYHGGCTKAI